ncbi:MAG TPA: TonB-dependent receptor, partial [Chryseosolibacter sp.]|nr:TonB-dependent receptor [Chryseosolibacter sp.]
LEGPLVADKLSLIAGARLSNVNWILRKADNKDVRGSNVRFYDLYTGLSARVGLQHAVSANFLHTGDYFKFSDRFGYKWASNVASVQSKSTVTEKLSAYTLIARGEFTNSFFDPSGADAATITNGIRYTQGKFTMLYTPEKHAITAGGEIVYYNSSPERVRPYGGSPVLPENVTKEKGVEYAFFAEDEWTASESVSLSFGLRASFFHQLGPDSIYLYEPGAAKSEHTIVDRVYRTGSIATYQGLEPRFSARVNLSAVQSIKFSYSRLLQYLHTISNTLAPTPIDLWQVSTTYLRPQVSQMFSAGYFHNFKNETWTSSLEFFFKPSRDQVEYVDFAQLFLNPHIETELLQGEGRSYGAELFVKKNIGDWTGWLSYTYSRSLVRIDGPTHAERVNDGRWFPSNHDRPHVTSLVLHRKFYPRGAFNVSFTHSTGRPVSAVISNYVVNGVSVPNYSYRNEYRIPNYFRIDVSILVGNVFNKADDSLTIGVYNLLSRRNAYSVFFKKGEDSFIMVPYKLSVLGTMFPSVTYTLSLTKTK